MTMEPITDSPRTDPDAAAITRAKELLARMRDAHGRDPFPGLERRLLGLERLARVLIRRQGDIAEAVSRDFGGRSRHETLIAEVFVTVHGIRAAQKHLAGWMSPRSRPVDLIFQPGRATVIPQPLGVVGIISPWNYPLQLALAPLVAVLSAGNRALVKPSEFTPRTAAILGELLGEVFPEDQVAVVAGGTTLAEAFSALPFDHLVFTGSTRVGKAVMRAAAENLTPVTLELGGKSPVIVGGDAPIADTAARVMVGKCFNAGQTCIAPDWALVPQGSVDDFVERCRSAVAKMYPTLVHNPDYTAIINPRHRARLQAMVDDARQRGHRVVELNPSNETLDAASGKLCPTLVIDPSDDALVMQEEIFGPVFPVRTYRGLGDAIAQVNVRPRPLALYYFGRDRKDIDRVLRETVSGGVTVNETLIHFAIESLPFGGVGPSGMGHYHGADGFDAFSKLKPVFEQHSPNATAALRPPFGRAVEALLKVLIR